MPPLRLRRTTAPGARLLPPGAAIGGLSAAYLWGVDLLPATAVPVTLVVPPPLRLREHLGLAVWRSPLRQKEVTRFAGLPVTTGLRTAFDLGRRPPRPEAVVAVDALAHRRLAKPPMLTRLCADRAGWPGVPLLREVVSLAEPLTESPVETRLRLLLCDGGLPRPVAQHDVSDRLGRFVARIDLAYPQWRIGIAAAVHDRRRLPR